jgi:hypothetical protein
MKEKSADFFLYVTIVVALDFVELVCIVIFDNGTGMIIPPQAPLAHICLVLEVDQTVSSNAY